MAAKLSPLPERLKYLQPFRKKFASKPPEELNEDTGVEPLMKLLAKRLAGLPDDEAKALIHADLAEMEGWLDPCLSGLLTKPRSADQFSVEMKAFRPKAERCFVRQPIRK